MTSHGEDSIKKVGHVGRMGTDIDERESERELFAEHIQNYGVGSLVRTGLGTFGEWRTRDSKTTHTVPAQNHGESKKT